MSSGEGEGPAIGIDLGTTYSCVGVWRNDRVEIIPNDQGNRITPSYVAFKGDERLVGDGAKNLAASNPTNTIFDAKRLIGRRFTDSTVENDMTLWPFKVAAGQGDKPMIVVQFKGEDKRFTAEEISAMVLSKMKETAETFLGRDVRNAVVTVPAYFNDSQRRCTKDAGTIAGLNVMRIINEPTAAALAYGLEQRSSGPKPKMTVLIFDLGGGTFDVSLLEIENGNIDVKATAGDTHLGGEDFDSRMVSHLAEEFARKHRKDLRDNPRALRRLRTACERAKRNLSFTTVVPVEVDCLYEGVDFNTTFTRAKFEDLNADLFAKCISVLEQCLNDAQMDKTRIDEAVLVGGSTRIPRVQQMLKDFLHGKALCSNLHADEAVAYGASILAAMLGGTDSRLAKQLVLSDVTPISLGSSNSKGVMEVFIPKNTPIPDKRPVTTTVEKERRNLTTVTDYQTSVLFEVYEGERAMASDNNLIGSFDLLGITPQPAYVPKLRVVFRLDVDGILSVSAEDRASGSSASVTITNDGGRLTKDEIDRMAWDAVRYKQEDEQRRRKADARSELERFAYVTRNTIRSPSGTSKLQMAEKGVVERACADAVAWSESNASTTDEYDYRDKKVELEQLWNGIKDKLHL